MNNMTDYTLTIFTENIPGVLYRIADVFLRRKINVESLTVSELYPPDKSRFTIVINTTEEQIIKIAAQIEKIIEVLEVYYNTDEGLIYHEIALIKIAIKNLQDLSEVQKVVGESPTAKIFSIYEDSIVIEESGTEKEVRGFIEKLGSFKIQDLAISGRTAVLKNH